MNNTYVKAQSLTKRYGRRTVFRDLEFCFQGSGIYGISGSNGTGKSTLALITAGVISPTRGRVVKGTGSSEISDEKLNNFIGFAAPYLVLYEELTAAENISYISRIRGKQPSNTEIEQLFDSFGLLKRMNDEVRAYSSGMKQRLKIISALIHSPGILILDEPSTNLDGQGKDMVYTTLNRIADNVLIIIASNERSDLELCGSVLNVEEYGNRP